jgi:hypothetical protein
VPKLFTTFSVLSKAIGNETEVKQLIGLWGLEQA